MKNQKQPQRPIGKINSLIEKFKKFALSDEEQKSIKAGQGGTEEEIGTSNTGARYPIGKP